MNAKNHNIRGVLMAFLAFLFFSTHDLLIKFLTIEYSVFQIIFFTAIFTFIPISLLMATDGTDLSFRPQKPWLIFWRVICVVISMVGAFTAFSTLPMTEAYAIFFMAPMFVTMLSVPLLGEKVGKHRWAAVVIGMIGVLIVLRPTVSSLTIGHLGAAVSAISSSVTIILTRKLGRSERSAGLMLFPMAGIIIAMAFILPDVYIAPSLSSIAMLALIAGLSFVGQLFLIIAYKYAEAAMVAPIQYSQILWATIFGLIFFQDHPDHFVFIGICLIIGSGIYSVMREQFGGHSLVKPMIETFNHRPDTGLTIREKIKNGTHKIKNGTDKIKEKAKSKSDAKKQKKAEKSA